MFKTLKQGFIVNVQNIKKTFHKCSNCVHNLHSSDFTFFHQYKCSCPRVRIILSISRPHFPSFEYLSHFLYVHVTKYTKCVRCLYIPDKIQLPWQTVFINSSSLKNLRRFMVIIICLCIQISNLIIFSSTPTCLFSGDTSIAQCWPLLSAHCTLHTPVCTVQSPAPHQSRVHWQCHVKIKWKTVSVHTCDKNAGVYILS